MNDQRQNISELRADQKVSKQDKWLGWLARLAIVAVIPALLLVLTEGALRLFNVGYSTELMEPRKVHGQPSTCYNLFFTAPFFPPGIIRSPSFFCAEPQKSASTYRIVILGESAAAGDPDAAYSFGRYLQLMLGARFPDTKIEVINTGVVAINSHVSLIMARELGKYKPDLMIIYAGSNEVVGPYGPGTVLTSSSLKMPIIRASIFVRSLRIGQLLTGGAKKPGEWQGMEMFLDKPVRFDSPGMEYAYSNFSENLKDIVKAAEDSGAHTILSTIATNLRGSSPFQSMHRKGLNQGALQKWTQLVEQGNTLAGEGAFQDALEAYRSAATIDDQYAELHFRMARCYEASGDLAGASSHYVRARDLDVLRFRADSRINEIIRSVAKTSGPRVKLLDAEELLSSKSHDGIIGNDLLFDHVHFRPATNYLFARAAFDDVVQIWPSRLDRPAVPGGTLSEAECDHLLALTDFDRVRLAREVLDRVQRQPFRNQMTHAEQVQELTLEANAPTSSIPGAIAQYQWAIAQHPDDLMLHYKYGSFLFNFDRTAAIREFILARPNDEFPVFLPDGSSVR